MTCERLEVRVLYCPYLMRLTNISKKIMPNQYSNGNSSTLERMRHSFAHVLAQAVLRLYPDAKLGIGPAVPDGFYYDFQTNEPISAEDLPQLEAEMKKIIQEELPFKQLIVSREQAFDTLHQLGQIFKTELLQQVPDEHISFFKTGEEFIDLCRGPHVNHTGVLKVFKLTGISSTHWLGDDTRPLMQRIHGVAFDNRSQLEEYLSLQEEIKLRDHRKLGKEMGIFYIDEAIGDSLPIFLEKGVLLKNNLKGFLHSQLVGLDPLFVDIPTIAREQLFNNLKEIDTQKAASFPSFSYGNEKYRLKNTSLPLYFQIFKSKNRSYKEIPFRIGGFSDIYLKTKTAQEGLLGSARSELDSFISFVSPEKIAVEVALVLEKMISVAKGLGFSEYRLQFGLPHADKIQSYLGGEKLWKEALDQLKKGISILKSTARSNEGGADYNGPTISLIVKDYFRRDWELSKLTLDLTLPGLSGIRYFNNKNEEVVPGAIEYTFFSGLEKLIALLIEHYGGAFPLWMAPNQISIIPISEKFNQYAKSIYEKFFNTGLRVKLDMRDETMQAKIREAQLDRVPYMLIIGEKEQKTDSISVRPRNGQDSGLMRINEFIEGVVRELA